MTGKDFKIAIERTNVPLTEIAKKLGILQQSLYTYFRADDVKSGTIEKVAQVLGVPVGYFYGFDEAAHVQQPTTDIQDGQLTEREKVFVAELNAKNRLIEQLAKALTDRTDAKEKTAV